MPFHNLTQINQAISDMYNVFCQLPIEAEEFLAQKFHEHMAKRNNTSIYTYKIFQGFYETALRYGVNIKGASILEIGAGKALGTGLLWKYAGAKSYTSIDKFTDINLSDLWLERFETLLEMNLFPPENFNIDSQVYNENGQLSLNTKHINLIRKSFEDYPFEKDSFDLIYSCAVLEHLTNIDKIFAKMHHILSERGIMIHNIDLREHHTRLRRVPDKDTSTDFLGFSTQEWNNLYPPGSADYINRLRASDFRNLFLEAGFNIIEFSPTQRMSLDDSVYSKIHPEFHRYSLDDLEILGLRVIVEK